MNIIFAFIEECKSQGFLQSNHIYNPYCNNKNINWYMRYLFLRTLTISEYFDAYVTYDTYDTYTLFI